MMRRLLYTGCGLFLCAAAMLVFLSAQFLFLPFCPAADAAEVLNTGESGTAGRVFVFSDVPAEHPQAAFINYLAQRKLISGFPDGTYRPGESLTRAQAAHILANILGLRRETAGSGSFSDVSSSHWAFASIEAAVRAGYLKGYPDGSFRPEQPISRAEGIVLALRLSREPLPGVTLPQLNDVSGNYWAAREIAAALDAGLIGLKAEKQFAPAEALTRGGMARAFAVMLVLAPGCREAELEGVLTPLKGEVMLKKAGESSYRTLEKSEKVKGGDSVQTGANGSARITFDDGSDIKLEPGTQINLTKNAGLRYIKKDGQPGVMVDLLGVELKVGEIFGALASHTTEEMNETAAVVVPGTQVRTYAMEEGTEKVSLRMPAAKVNLAAAQKELPWWKKPKQKRVRIEIEMAWGVCGVRGTFVHAVAERSGRGTVDALTGSLVVRSDGKEIAVQAGEKAVIVQRGEVATAKMEAADYKNWAKPEVRTWAIETAKNMDSNAPAPVARGAVVEETVKPAEVKPEEKPLEKPVEEKPQEVKPALPLVIATITETIQNALQQASSQAASAPAAATTAPSGGGGGGGGSSGPVTVLPPAATPPGGEYYTPITVTLTQPQGAQIKFTLDGSDPATSQSSGIYSGPIALNNSGTVVLRAVAVLNGRYSEPVQFVYTLNLGDYTRVLILADTLQRFAALNYYQLDFTLSLLKRLDWFAVLSEDQKTALKASGFDQEGFKAIVDAFCAQFYTSSGSCSETYAEGGSCDEKVLDKNKVAAFKAAADSLGTYSPDYAYFLNFADKVREAVPADFRNSLNSKGITADKMLAAFARAIAEPLDLLTVDANLMTTVNSILAAEQIGEDQKAVLRSWGVNWYNFGCLISQLDYFERQMLKDVLHVLRRSQGGTIRGTVYSKLSDGTAGGSSQQIPLAGISVECHRVFVEQAEGYTSSWLITYATTVTDSKGQFSFENLPWGEYEILAPADDRCGPSDGNYISVRESVYLDRDEYTAPANLSLLLEEGGSIAGRVYDASNGQGMARVWVYLYEVPDFAGGSTQPVMEPVLSGANGEYIFRGVKPGSYKIATWLPYESYESKYYGGWYGGYSYSEAQIIFLADKQKLTDFDIALMSCFCLNE